MTARHLSYVAVAGAAVIVLVSFALSAGAVISYATDIGVDHRLALALPVCLEALMVVAGAVMVARRIDDTAESSSLAVSMFAAAVVVTFAVNWAHGAAGMGTPTWVPAFLSAVPALSLPAALHLALEEWLRVRTQPKTRPARRRATTKTAKPGSSPRDVQRSLTPETNGHTNGNGAGEKKLTMSDIRDMFPDLVALDGRIEQAGSERQCAADLNAHPKQLRRRRTELLGAS